MPQPLFNAIWFILFVTICVVRKVHERKAGRYATLAGTPVIEATLIILWAIAVSVLPLLFLFSTWLDFANMPFTMPSAFGIIGTILFLFAIWLLHRSHADLGKLWTPEVTPEKHQQALISHGVYQRIRHPMYAAHVLWGIAQALLLPNLIAGPLALVLMIAVISLRIPREEQAMLDAFGDDYRRYMKTTGRILPPII